MASSLQVRSAIPVHGGDRACIELVNSRFDDHLGRGDAFDRLPKTEWQSWFVFRFRLNPAAAPSFPAADAARLRQDLEKVLDSWRAGDTLDDEAVTQLDTWVSRAGIRQRVRMSASGPTLAWEPLADDWNWALAKIAVSAVELISTGDRRRLKRCGNPQCSWMYYDRTSNGSKNYCSLTPCGTLMRVRRHRAKTRKEG